MAEPASEAEIDQGQDDDILLEGAVVAGRYTILEHLAAGGMGRVYVATQMPLGRKVALKVMHRELCSDTDSVKRFFREAVAVSQLTHPNTITVFDYGETEGNFYIAMEFLDGEPLSDRVEREGPMVPEDAVRIVSQVARSLSEAHRKGIIHRDLKPENIFLGNVERDLVKVLDFGIAKILQQENEGGTKLTRMGFVCGTPEYMSPEQARGEDLDGRSDLYALGVVLYEIISGEPPFMESTPLATVLKHQNDEVPPLPSSIPTGLASFIIDRAMAKESEDRPGSAEEFIEELEVAAVQSGMLLDTTGSMPGAELRRQLAEANAVAAAAVAKAEAEPIAAGPPATEVMQVASDGGNKFVVGVLAAVVALGLVVGIGVLLLGGNNDAANETDKSEQAEATPSQPEVKPAAGVTGTAPEPIDTSDLEEVARAATLPEVFEVKIEIQPPDAEVLDVAGANLSDGEGTAIVYFVGDEAPPASLTIKAPGYLTEEREIVPPEDRDVSLTETVELVPLPSFVLDSDPSGASVVAVGTETELGTTPLDVSYDPAAGVSLEIRIDGYESTPFVLEAGANAADSVVELKKQKRGRRDRDNKVDKGKQDKGDAKVIVKTDEPEQKDPPKDEGTAGDGTPYKPFQ